MIFTLIPSIPSAPALYFAILYHLFVFSRRDRGQGPTPGCMQRAGQCSQGLDLLFGKVDSAARRLEALISAKQAIARRLDAAQVR